MTLTDLWTLCIFKRDGGWCQKCMSEDKWTRAIDAHHIIHKDTGFLRYLIDNGVALCRTCHDLDAQGKLLRWCKDHIGEEKYWQMKLEGHERLGQPYDENEARRVLKAYLAISVSDPGVSS